MRKLALIIACFGCITFQSPAVKGQDVLLDVENPTKIRQNNFQVEVNFTNEAEFGYLRVYDPSRYLVTKLGYAEKAVYTDVLDLNDYDYQYLEVTLKDLKGDADWGKVYFSMYDVFPNHSAKVSDYLHTAEQLEDGWFKIFLPLDEITSSSKVSYITFPNAFNVDLGVRQIRLIGSGEPLIWLGKEKYDNARKDNQVGQSSVVYSREGETIDYMRLYVEHHYASYAQFSMPFNNTYNIKFQEGSNQIYAYIRTKEGNDYYSDTTHIIIPKGVTAAVNHVSCYGASDGSIDVSVEGGVAPYIYLWSNGETTEDISGLPHGNYRLEVNDAEGKSAEIEIQINQPASLSTKWEEQGCSGESALLIVGNGTAPYQYSLGGSDFVPMGNTHEEVWRLETGQSSSAECRYNHIEAIAEDKEGNIYAAGRAYGEMTFGDGVAGKPNEYMLFMVKTDAFGNFLWSTNFEILYPDCLGFDVTVKDIVTDDEGNVTFLINDASIMLDNAALHGSHLISMQSDGKVKWSKRAAFMTNLDIDGHGNLYGSGAKNVSGEHYFNSRKIELNKYDLDGNRLWSKTIYGTERVEVNDMHISNQNEVYLFGTFHGTLDFEGLTHYTKGNGDFYIAKCNSDGDIIWARSGGSNVADFGWALTTDSQGSIFAVVGVNENSIFQDELLLGGSQILLKMEPSDGSLVWSRPFARSGFPFFQKTFDITTLNDEQIFLTTLTFGFILRPGENFITNQEENFILGFDYEANMIYSKDIGFFTYDSWLSYPLTATRDNHVVFSDISGVTSLIKYGAPMQAELTLPDSGLQVVIRDNQGCEYTVDRPDPQDNLPATPAICTVSSGQEGNSITISEVEDKNIVAFKVYRETLAVGDYEYLGQVAVHDPNYLDVDADIAKRSYGYVVTAVDDCGKESRYSDKHVTMHLTVNEGHQGQINLIWDGYEGIDYNSYMIYRGSSVTDMEMITSVPSYLYTYTDLDPSIYTQYYQVRIEADNSCVSKQNNDRNGRLQKSDEVSEIGSNVASRYGDLANLSAFPIPADDKVTISFSPDGHEHTVEVIDNSGRSVMTMHGVEDQATIDRRSLPSGIYTVVVSGVEGSPLYGRIIFK